MIACRHKSWGCVDVCLKIRPAQIVTEPGGVASPEEFATLVEAVATRRDRVAFAQLFDHFAPRLHAYLLRLRLDPIAADELTQDVMSILWQKAKLFDPAKSSVATWLFRIARNRRIDLLRRERDEAPVDDRTLNIPDPSLSPDDSLNVAQRERMIRGALDVLPREQLELVRLAFFDGLTHSEIATMTGLPLGTVKSRLRLAFSRLRRALHDEGIGSAD
jgi:RNA polymerase sigma factor (sigma-70 family)